MYPCKYCGKEVQQSEKFLSGLGSRQKIWCNDSCRGKWRYKNDPKIRDRDVYAYQKNRAYTNKYAALKHRGGKCVVCGETDPALLCFHHREPEKKSMKLDGRTFGNRSWESICEEVEKCDVYCYNHHMLLHYGETWRQNLPEYYEDQPWAGAVKDIKSFSIEALTSML